MHTQSAASSQALHAHLFEDYEDPTEDESLAMALSDILESGTHPAISNWYVCEQIAAALGWRLANEGRLFVACGKYDLPADDAFWSDDVPHLAWGVTNYRLAAFGFVSWLEVYLMSNRDDARKVVAAMRPDLLKVAA